MEPIDIKFSRIKLSNLPILGIFFFYLQEGVENQTVPYLIRFNFFSKGIDLTLQVGMMLLILKK